VADRSAELVPLEPGVYAWLHEPSGSGYANAGVVVDADGITVVDTLAVRSQWEPFAAAVDDLGRPVRRVVLTSSHVEFAGGTSRFRMAAVYGRRQASAHLDQPADPAVLRRLLPALAGEFDDDFTTRPVSHVVDAPVQLTAACAALPTVGEQAENLVVVVPAAGIVFAGAMCSFGVTPLAYQGDPAAWADALDDIVELAPIIVPGHGPVGGEEEVRVLQSYLRACVAADGDPARLGPGPWSEWPGREHDVVNVERAARRARGDDSIPQSLLDRLGLA
jgi:cyclase